MTLAPEAVTSTRTPLEVLGGLDLAGKTPPKVWKSVVAGTGSAEAHAGLAKAYENQGNNELAIAEYERAVEKNPNDPFAIAGLKRLRESGAKGELKVPVKTQPE